MLAAFNTSLHRQLAFLQANQGAGRAPGRGPATPPGRKAPAPRAATTAPAPRPPLAPWPPCRETGSPLRATRRRGIPGPPPPPATPVRARTGPPASAPCPRPPRRAAGSVTPPGTTTHGKSGNPATAIIMAGSPLSHVATPSTPARAGASAPAGGKSPPRHCGRADCQTCPSSLASARRTDRNKTRRKEWFAGRVNSSAAACTSRPISQCPV